MGLALGGRPGPTNGYMEIVLGSARLNFLAYSTNPGDQQTFFSGAWASSHTLPLKAAYPCWQLTLGSLSIKPKTYGPQP